MNEVKDMKKVTIPVLIQVLFCIMLLVFPLYMMSRSGELDTVHYSMFFIRTSILIILFYINYLYLIDKFLFNKKFIAFIGFNILISIILLVLQNFIIDLLISGHQPLEVLPPAHRKSGGPPSPYMRYWGDILAIILVVGLSVALKATLRWFEDSINMEKIKAVQLETDLRNLRSQLNPHFLFNTLNNIYSLIAIDSGKAQDSVIRLSNLLRYILYENNASFVPLSQDLEFTKNYIDLMKLRIGSDIKLNISIACNDSQDVIAPLMFMTLIENAFKHGINNEDNSYIDINILTENGKRVICLVENSMSEGNNIETKNSGIGLPNLQKRLELLYPQKHDLVIKKKDNSFFAQLRIDF